MKLYKLTDQERKTKNGVEWKVGEVVSVASDRRRRRPKLCSSGVVHAYIDPQLALLLNPNHANIDNPRLFEVEGEIQVQDWGKVGSYELTTIAELPIPKWYSDVPKLKRVRVRFAVLCARSVLHLFEKKCLDDERPRKAIEAAELWLDEPTSATADAAHAATAAHAAYASAYAAYASAYAAYAAYATAAYAAANAAYAAANAAYAAYAAANAAYAAATAYAAYAVAEPIDFAALAQQAVREEI